MEADSLFGDSVPEIAETLSGLLNNISLCGSRVKGLIVVGGGDMLGHTPLCS